MHVSQPDSSFHLWPRSGSGVIGVALATLFLVVFGLNLWTSGGGEQHGFLVFATFLTALGALAGLIISVVTIVRRHERSLLLFFPLAIGLLVIAFLAIEFFVSHD